MKVAVMAGLLAKWDMYVNARQRFFSLIPNNYRDNILDLIINEPIKISVTKTYTACNALQLYFFAKYKWPGTK